MHSRGNTTHPYVGSAAFYRLAGRNEPGAFIGWRWRRAWAADAATQQLDSVVVAADRIHGCGALCSSGCIAQSAPQHKQQLRVAITALVAGAVGSGFAVGGQPQDCCLFRVDGLLG